jgi:glycosyltransferase involved in cell wall biosynthesis
MVSSKETPVVDILMATYNGEKYLKEQIDSILNQSFNEFELIIVDDCSSDSTAEILEQYAIKDKRIKLFFNSENLGVQLNFEKLLGLSTAPLFMLSDQDDVWHEEKVKQSIQCIERTPALLCYSDLRVVDHNLNKVHESFWEYEKITPLSGKPWRTLLSQNFVTGCTIIAKRQLKEYALPFPQDILMHDWWLAMVASVYGEIEYMVTALLDYRQHGNNEVGARGFGSQYLVRSEEAANGYMYFLNNRKKYIYARLFMLRSYEERFSKANSGTEIILSIKKLSQIYNELLEVKRIDIHLKGFRLKFKYSPSQGIIRNIWWGIYLSLPGLAYTLLDINLRRKRS